MEAMTTRDESLVLTTKPCLIDVGRFRWELYNGDSLFQASAESFETQEEARANGTVELDRLRHST
jgi:hypothetical protein